MPLLRRVKDGSVRETGNRNRRRDRQASGRQPIRPVFSPPHVPALPRPSPFFSVSPAPLRANRLRIRYDILLQIQIIEQLEI